MIVYSVKTGDNIEEINWSTSNVFTLFVLSLCGFFWGVCVLAVTNILCVP